MVARAQLLGIGIGEDSVEGRLRAGSLLRVHRGVYAVGHRVLSREARWLAAVLACGEGAALSHWSAAALWGIRDPRSGPIDVTSSRKTRSRGAIRRHRALLEPDEATTHEGIPTTTVPRTILDLAAISDTHVAESALRQAEFLRRYDALSLPALLRRHPGHRGSPAIRTALARVREAPGQTDSKLEERFLRFLDAHRLPRPRLNVWITAVGHRYKVDCLWPAKRQIVELDSWQAHGTRSSFQSDRSRNRRLEAAGYRVTHVTWHQLDHEASSLAADLRALLTSQ